MLRLLQFQIKLFYYCIFFVIQSILGRADVGMSASLIEIVTANLNVEDDSKIDYDALLSGPCVTASSTSTIPRVLLPSSA